MVTPACSSRARTARAISTALGVSPWTQIESICVAILRPDAVIMAPSNTISVARAIYADRAYAEDGLLMPRSQPGAVLRARHKQAIFRISTVGINLARDFQSLRERFCLQFRLGRSQKGEAWIDSLHRARNGSRSCLILRRHVAQGPMRLDMGQPCAGVSRKAERGARLIGNDPLDLTGGQREFPPSESPEVRKAWVSPNRHPFLLRRLKNSGHDLGVARMKAAGGIDACNYAEHGGVIAHSVRAETFAAIAV